MLWLAMGEAQRATWIPTAEDHAEYDSVSPPIEMPGNKLQVFRQQYREEHGSTVGSQKAYALLSKAEREALSPTLAMIADYYVRVYDWYLKLDEAKQQRAQELRTISIPLRKAMEKTVRNGTLHEDFPANLGLWYYSVPALIETEGHQGSSMNVACKKISPVYRRLFREPNDWSTDDASTQRALAIVDYWTRVGILRFTTRQEVYGLRAMTPNEVLKLRETMQRNVVQTLDHAYAVGGWRRADPPFHKLMYPGEERSSQEFTDWLDRAPSEN